jgi:glutaredoxin 2
VSGGVSITVPIYDGKQKKMQQDKISIAEQTRQNYRDYYRKQFSQQIAQLSQQLNATTQLINQTAPQIKYTETLIEANRKLMETGDARMADYIIAIGNFLTTKNIITQNSINKLQIINQINYWNRK